MNSCRSMQFNCSNYYYISQIVRLWNNSDNYNKLKKRWPFSFCLFYLVKEKQCFSFFCPENRREQIKLDNLFEQDSEHITSASHTKEREMKTRSLCRPLKSRFSRSIPSPKHFFPETRKSTQIHMTRNYFFIPTNIHGCVFIYYRRPFQSRTNKIKTNTFKHINARRNKETIALSGYIESTTLLMHDYAILIIWSWMPTKQINAWKIWRMAFTDSCHERGFRILLFPSDFSNLYDKKLIWKGIKKRKEKKKEFMLLKYFNHNAIVLILGLIGNIKISFSSSL